MSNSIHGPWTEERVQLLRRMRLVEGLSCGAIADALSRITGHRFTRNAVIAKCDRLKFDTPEHLRQDRSKQAVSHSNRKRTYKPRDRVVRAVAPPPPPPKAHKQIGATRGEWNMRYADAMGEDYCKRFVAEESGLDGMVCARATDERSAWCSECRADIFQPLKLAAA